MLDNILLIDFNNGRLLDWLYYIQKPLKTGLSYAASIYSIIPSFKIKIAMSDHKNQDI